MCYFRGLVNWKLLNAETSVVTISSFAVNTRLLHCTIFLLVTLLETIKTVSLNLLFPSCHSGEL